IRIAGASDSTVSRMIICIAALKFSLFDRSGICDREDESGPAADGELADRSALGWGAPFVALLIDVALSGTSPTTSCARAVDRPTTNTVSKASATTTTRNRRATRGKGKIRMCLESILDT